MSVSVRQNLNNAGIKVTDLPSVTLPVTGAEVVMLVQGGISKKATLTDVQRPLIIGYMSLATPAGVSNDVTPPSMDQDTQIIDVSTPAGNAQWTGLIAGQNGQRIVITNLGPNQLRLDALNAGSAPANQFRETFNTSLLVNTSIEVMYSTDVSKWLVIP